MGDDEEKKEQELPPHRLAWIAFYGKDHGRDDESLTRKTKPEELARIDALYYWLGVTLLSSQKIEQAHYGLFEKILGVPRNIGSTIYFHLPSFGGRCDLLNKLIKKKLDEDRINEWDEISKRIRVASQERNKMAHYRMSVGFVDEHLENIDDWKLMVRMEQAYHKEKQKVPSRLSIADIFNHNKRYEKLSKDINMFREALYPFSSPSPY
jgi:hypothetical protein